MQQKNLLLAFVLSAVILLGWVSLSHYIWPPQPPKQESPEIAKKDEAQKPNGEEAAKSDAKENKKEQEKDKKPGEKKPDEKKKISTPERIAEADLQQLPETPPGKLIDLGSMEGGSRYHLYVKLDPRGAGVHSVWLNKYQAANKYGEPAWRDPEKKKPMLLALVPPPGPNAREPSFQMFAFDVHAPNDEQPLDMLARINWKGFDRKTEEVNGRRRQMVSFQAETQGVRVTKTYTLTEGEYHLGLRVSMRRAKEADKTIAFRYQMTGAHGLPVEGKWYTSTFRNALIALVDKNGGVTRDLQDLRQISNWGGGNEVRRDPENALIYASVANPFFASVLAVDNEQKNRGFLRQARPTLETAMTKGTIVSTAEDGSSFVLKPASDEPERTFYLPNENVSADVRKGEHLALEASRNNLNAYVTLLLQNQPLTAVGCSSYFLTTPIPQFAVRLDDRLRGRFRKGQRVAILHHTASAPDRNGEYPEIATASYGENAMPALWADDITVRVSTEPVELKDDIEVVHKYLLYNGPVKVSQLFPPPGLPNKPFEQGGVQPELFARYHDDLHLNTLTDYHSPGPMGRFSNAIYWTALVIKCTNIMHAVLGYLRATHLPYGLCIIVLTILVRGMMFPLSRKQALMSVRMQQLQPELKKLQEKHKDDRQTLGMAQMELYRKHGVNPFGSCWVLLLQMPIFMGLYYALQESTHFRLAPLWPWITNLAAPDMLFRWGEHIWWISRVEDYGSFFYLGPYFNLLPVIAVVLMIAQQKMMTPPPADEQQAMQQKMMKYMMVFFGLMFYKVAAGLCLYFIASSAWGFCERKLLPKKLTNPSEPLAPAGESYFQKLLRRAQGGQATPAPATGITTRNGGATATAEMRGRSGGRRRGKRRPGAAGDETATEDSSMLGRWRKRLHDWWIAVLKEAEKKNRG